MNLIAPRYKSIASLAALLVAVVPLVFTACGGGMVVPADTLQRSSGPAILSVVPNSGPQTGGVKVTINGSNFTGGTKQGPPTIAFGGVQATQVAVLSPTQVTAIVPPHAAGPVTVEITNPAGQSTGSPDAFTYGATSPVITSITPNSGPTAGGTAVTITGSGFASGAAVSFGGTVSTGISFISSTQLNALTPAHAAGAVTITVTNPDGSQGTLSGAFTYNSTSSTVTVNSITPNSGPTTGGTAVTITGSGFVSGAAVAFGGTASAGISFISSTQLNAKTPAHAAGAVTITVTNPDGSQGTLPGAFTYSSTPSTVTVSSVTPNSGPTTGGTAVTVTGSGFANGAVVSFGGTAGSGISILSATQVRATTPSHAAGAVTVTVTNTDGSQGTLAAGYTYGSTQLSISSVSPISGPAAGGTQVTITGTNFQSGASVTFGGLAATSVTVGNSTIITATTPAHSSGTVNVTVTNTDGTTTTLASGYKFHSVDLNWNAPASSPVTIIGYNVYRGPASGGPFVMLNGSNPVTGSSYSDTTVQGSTTYYYEVKSVDSNGTESSPDGPVQVTTSP